MRAGSAVAAPSTRAASVAQPAPNREPEGGVAEHLLVLAVEDVLADHERLEPVPEAHLGPRVEARITGVLRETDAQEVAVRALAHQDQASTDVEAIPAPRNREEPLVLRPPEERLPGGQGWIEVARAHEDLAVEVGVLTREPDAPGGRGFHGQLQTLGSCLAQVHVGPLEGGEVQGRECDLVQVLVVVEGRLGAQPVAEQALLDAEVEGSASLGLEVRVAHGEEGQAEGLEEVRLLDASPSAGPERCGAVPFVDAPCDGGAGHHLGPEAVVVLDAPSDSQEDVPSEDHAILDVGPHVGPLRREQLIIRPRPDLAGLALHLRSRADQVPAARLDVRLVAGGQPPRVVLEALGIGEVGDGKGSDLVAPPWNVGAGVERVAGELLRTREPDPYFVGGSLARVAPLAADDEARHVEGGVEVGPPEGRLARRAGRARLSAEDETQVGALAQARAERGRARGLLESGVGLLVVRLDAQDARRPVESAGPARRSPLEAAPGEAAAFRLGAQAGRLAGIRASGDELDHAGEGVRAVEAAGRSAHDLDAVELEGELA